MPAANVSPYTVTLNGQKFTVRSWRGEEGISTLFQFRVVFDSENLSLSLKNFVGKSASLAIQWKSGGPEGKEQKRSIHGIVSRISQIGVSDVSGQEARANYLVEIVPRMWTLTLRENCRIFQEKKTDEIVLAVLKEHGIKGGDVKKKIQGSCQKHVYCVQYRETDFDFVSRLLEEEGICYFYNFTSNKDVVVLANFSSAHPDADPESDVFFHRATGQDLNRQFVYECNYQEQMVTGASALNDFNFTTSRKSLYGEKKGKRFTSLEIYSYPGRYDEKSRGKDLSKIRLEEFDREERVLSGQSNCYCFSAGKTVQLKDHYNAQLNQKYTVLSVVHEADISANVDSAGNSGYSNEFRCIPGSVTFRPPRTAARPIVEGPQTAFVVGPKDEEIYVDEFGRVKVQFHWDREGKYNEKSSCWIRVSENWAGAKYGFRFIPRIGQEVVVDFLEGDPDRPLITGSVYNDKTEVPYPLPQEKTKSTIKTNSSKGGEGFNEIRFEDKKDKEQIFINAQRQMDVRVGANHYHTVGGDHHVRIGGEDKDGNEVGEHFEFVQKGMHIINKGSRAEWVEKDNSLTIKGSSMEKIDESRSLKVGQNFDQDVGQTQKVKVGSASHLKAGQTIVLDAGMDITLKAGGGFIKIDMMGVTIQGTMVKINSGGAATPVQSANPQKPLEPEEAKDADKDEPGKVDPAMKKNG